MSCFPRMLGFYDKARSKQEARSGLFMLGYMDPTDTQKATDKSDLSSWSADFI